MIVDDEDVRSASHGQSVRAANLAVGEKIVTEFYRPLDCHNQSQKHPPRTKERDSGRLDRMRDGMRRLNREGTDP